MPNEPADQTPDLAEYLDEQLSQDLRAARAELRAASSILLQALAATDDSALRTGDDA